MIRSVLPFLIVSCLLMACSASQKVVTTPTQQQIRFGHGGGFTGAVTEYCLTSKGELYKKVMGDINKLSVSKEDARQCFDKCQSIQFGSMDINSPGNFYAFISYHQQDSIHRINWNPYQPSLSTDLRDFHNMLLALAGEEPITVTPDDSPTTAGDKIIKKKTIGKLKPHSGNSNDKKKELKMNQIKHKKLKKSKM